jgi:hypothetical protein
MDEAKREADAITERNVRADWYVKHRKVGSPV